MPIASARVRTTSMVCGSASASTTKGPAALRLRAAYERHRLGGGGALVEQRRVGGRQAGEVADHGLEVEQRLEPALRDLRLVRRVGGVPARVLEHVAPDHRRGDGAVVAEPDHRLGRPVAGRQGSQLARGAPARTRRGAGRALPRPDRAGDRGGHQRVEGVDSRGAASIVATSSSRSPMWRSANGRVRRRARPGMGAGHRWVTKVGSSTVGSGRLPLCHPRRVSTGAPELPGPRGPGA